jgi:hypothetical protein
VPSGQKCLDSSQTSQGDCAERKKMNPKVSPRTNKKPMRKLDFLRRLGFSQTNSKRDQLGPRPKKVHQEGICSDPKSVSRHQSIPNNTHNTKTRRFFTNPQREGREEHKNKIDSKFQQKKLSKRVEPALWMDPTTLPLNSKVKITNTDTISKHLWISATLGMKTRVSKC